MYFHIVNPSPGPQKITLPPLFTYPQFLSSSLPLFSQFCKHWILCKPWIFRFDFGFLFLYHTDMISYSSIPTHSMMIFSHLSYPNSELFNDSV